MNVLFIGSLNGYSGGITQYIKNIKIYYHRQIKNFILSKVRK